MHNLIKSIKQLSKENFPNDKVYELLNNSYLKETEIADYIKKNMIMTNTLDT